MHLLAVALMAIWAALNLVLAVVARTDRLAGAVFFVAAVCLGVGLALGRWPLVFGLVLSLVAPILFGMRIERRVHLAHHVVRALVVIGLGAFYWYA